MQSPPSWPPPDWRRRRPPPGQRLLSPAAVLLLAVLLLGSQPAARAQRVSEFLTALWGARCFHPPAGEERVTLKCLHTVAPPPFNWTMNCPEQVTCVRSH